MTISFFILILGGVHLLMLIAAVYMLTFLKMRHSVRIKWTGLLITAVQMFNLALLQYVVVGYDGGFLTTAINFELLFIAQGIFTLFIISHIYFLLRGILTRHRMLSIPHSIREAIDHLPGGICFSTPKGTPVLTNHRMNELIFLLTNNTIINAQHTWEELERFDSKGGCFKLEDIRMEQNIMSDTADECMFFSFPDSRIWRFSKDELAGPESHYVQLEAMDITDLYSYSKELYDNNQRLAKQFERQRELLENIVEINREKELLATKIRIHDDLGRSIIITKQHLWNQTLSGSITDLAEIWNNTIRSLTDFSHISADADASPEAELLLAAEMIGCRINFFGDRPANRKTELLLYATVREALTNAVKHAKADQLYVEISRTDKGYDVEISDNGAVPIKSITEGNGLGNLRKRLEQVGATLAVSYSGGVVLTVHLPTR